jgi:hypothetical protein
METNPRGPLRKLGVVTQLALAAGIVVVLLIAWAIHALQPSAPTPTAPARPEIVAPPPVVTEKAPPLTRRELVVEADAIAAAYAAGTPREPGSKHPLIGREFAVRVPFGCSGPAGPSSGAQAYYEIDPEGRTLRIVARPIDWTAAVAPRGDAPKSEGVEGFWLSRPWSHSENCPTARAAPTSAAATPPSVETLGLATFRTDESSRIGRRAGRPYEFVKKLGEDDALPVGEAYRLVLEGVVTGLPDGRAARCWSESADHRPICLYAVEFSRIALERQNGELLTEWRPG